MLRRDARHFHNRAFRSKITFEAHNATCFRDGGFNRIDHPPIGFPFDQIQLFTHGTPSGGHTIFVHQTRFAQFFHYNRNTTNLIEVFSDVLPTGLQIDKVRCIAENIADIIKIKFQARLMSNRRQVQASISRSARTSYNPRRVLQRFQCHDIAGANVLIKQVHHRFTGGNCILVARFIRRGSPCRIWQSQANRLRNAGHCIGRKLPAASARRGAGHRFQFFKLTG